MLFLWFKCTRIVQDYVCNEFHDLLMQCVNISNIAIIIVKGAEYCCAIPIIHGIFKSYAIT